MQNSLFKIWGIEPLNGLKILEQSQTKELEIVSNGFKDKKPIIKLPLQFTYPPVEIISKQLTKLNSKYKERILYLGPRWNDSSQWHKKLSKPNFHDSKFFQQNHSTKGYHFEQTRVQRNNSFINDSMNQNRFYKNEIYYRAFEGMNPTIDEGELVFESRFQSGNLDCVVKISENQYDLFLRIDTNTRGHLFWYYFKVMVPQNSKVMRRKVRFNICNITKSKTLYERNLKPYVKRRFKKQQQNSSQLDGWQQGLGIYNCKFGQKKLRYSFIYDKVSVPRVYELSFDIELNSTEQVSLAYCIPYTYSYLLEELSVFKRSVKEKNIQNVSIAKMGESLTGVEIPIIISGDLKNIKNSGDKKVVFITGRIHPGQSNSSLIVTSLINELCLKKTQIFSNRVIYVIVPMLNPDGVILGNGRCSALGKDLNRQFKGWNVFLNPEVVAVKRLIEKIQEQFDIQIYFDFHGHSKKKNIFFFGPGYPLTEPNYYRCRIFPKILSKNLDFFRYFGCSFSLTDSKNTTARAVMLEHYKIPFFYTVETSVGFYYDYIKRRDAPFNKNALFKIGVKFKESLESYFEGVQQYENFLKGKRKQKVFKPETSFKILNEKLNQKELDSKNTDQNSKVANLKLVKMFQQIKTEVKNMEKIKKQENSETDSDSYRGSEELQIQKTKEFSEMLISLNRLGEKKIKPVSFTSRSQNDKFSKNNRQTKRKERKNSQIEDEMLSILKRMNKQQDSNTRSNHNFNRLDFFRQNKLKQVDQLSNEFYEEKSLILNSEPKKRSNQSEHLLQNNTYHNFFKRNPLELNLQQNKNLRFVNFSKVLENHRNLRFSQQGKSFRIGLRRERKSTVNESSLDQKDSQNASLNKYFMPFPSEKNDLQAESQSQFANKTSIVLNSSKPYPASFYRIKYQSSHRKYRNQTPDPNISDLMKKMQKSMQEDRFGSSKKKKQLSLEPQRLIINVRKFKN